MGEQRFKVGDRVRTIGGGDDGYIGVEGVIETDDGSTCRNLRVKLDKPIEKWGDTKIWRSAHHLEHVLLVPEQPATLKIEAGKFYKTRDGRKVGPMERFNGCGLGRSNVFNQDAAFTAPDLEESRDGGSYTSDGTWLTSNGNCVFDIIAEWIDEPAANASNDNAQPKFKVGDRVKSVEKGPTEGYVGVIIEDDESAVPFLVAFDDWDEGHGSADNEWWLQESEIIAAPPTTAIVALIENGQPKPSSTPHVHTSEVAAHKEAGRLAAKYKGKQFGVFTLTATHKEERVYEHKWQNMAALGLKVDEIRELRAVAGLDLLSAKRAVEAFAA